MESFEELFCVVWFQNGTKKIKMKARTISLTQFPYHLINTVLLWGERSLRVREKDSVTLTKQQQLQLPAGVFLVPPQLLLDLLVDPLVLPVLRRYATSSHRSKAAALSPNEPFCCKPENIGSFGRYQPVALLPLHNFKGDKPQSILHSDAFFFLFSPDEQGS